MLCKVTQGGQDKKAVDIKTKRENEVDTGKTWFGRRENLGRPRENLKKVVAGCEVMFLVM